MKKNIDKNKVIKLETMRESFSDFDSNYEANRCLLCVDAPCSKDCPAGTDPGKFIRQIKFLNIKGAARTIRNNNILGWSCSMLCPTEQLCEKNCTLAKQDCAVNISALQRYASEYGQKNNLEKFSVSAKNKGKIAVIGGGPAGIACAAELLKQDYSVTIYEKEASLGGVLRNFIPKYRLPDAVLEKDLNNLKDLGVEVVAKNVKIEKSFLTNLLSTGFNAVFISTGLALPYQLELFSGKTNSLLYSDFLNKAEKPANCKDLRVAVIGGGSVAIDCAVFAKAGGAESVYLISLEDLEHLPAGTEEIELAREMNIIFRSQSRIKDVITENNRVVKICGTEVSLAPKAAFHPNNLTEIGGSDFILPVDLVVIAIGAKGAAEPARWGLEVDSRNIIKTDENQMTSLPGAFSSGDAVSGGGNIPKAVGEGKKAALSIINYLDGIKNEQ